MNKRFRMILFVVIFCLLLTACGGNSKNNNTGLDENNNTENDGGDRDNPKTSTGKTGTENSGSGKMMKNRAFFDPFLHNAMMTEAFVFLPALNGDGARYFDTASRTDILFCFEPNCEHRGWRVDSFTGIGSGDHCAAHSLGGGNVFYLTDEYGYYFQWPNLVRTDRQGLNQKTIAKVDEPLDFQFYELYTDEYYCSTVSITYEHTQSTEDNGEVFWWIGEQLEKAIAGVITISLKDGSSRFIFRDDEHYDATVSDLYAYDDHLYFIETYLDAPFESLLQINEDGSNWQEVELDHREHMHAVLYDYDFANGELRKIFQRDNSDRVFRFGDGYILEQSDSITGDGAKLYRLDGELIRELPWKVSNRVQTDGTPILTSWDSGVTKYRMYDIATGEVLKEIDASDDQFNLDVAVGNSYYGMVSGNWSGGMRLAYISAEDFWSGAFDRGVVLGVDSDNE